MNQVLDHDHAHHEIEDHDRGLVFDLNTMDRRRVLKLLGFGGLRASLFTIVGCGPAGATGTPLASAGATAGASATAAASRRPRRVRAARSSRRRRPGPFRATARTAPMSCRRMASSGATSARASAPPPRSPPASRSRSSSRSRTRAATARRWLARRSISGTATARAGIRSIRNRSPTRTTCAASRRRTTAASSRSRASSRPAIPVAGPHALRGLSRLALATDEANRIATSQIALPKDACDLVYATDGYSQSIQGLSRVTLASDNVFRDDSAVRQLGTVTGDVASGLTVAATIPVSPGTA